MISVCNSDSRKANEKKSRVPERGRESERGDGIGSETRDRVRQRVELLHNDHTNETRWDCHKQPRACDDRAPSTTSDRAPGRR